MRVRFAASARRCRYAWGYAAARYFTGSRDDGMHFRDGALWGEESLIPVQRGTLMEQATLSAAISAYGAAHFELTVDQTPIRIEVTGPSAVAGIVQLGSTEVLAVDSSMELTPTTGTLLIALTRAPLDYDPDDDDWSEAEVRATFTRIVAQPNAECLSAINRILVRIAPSRIDEFLNLCLVTPLDFGSHMKHSTVIHDVIAGLHPAFDTGQFKSTPRNLNRAIDARLNGDELRRVLLEELGV